MLPFLGEQFGNASSIHGPGRRARAAIDDARDALAGLLGVRPHELIFTSGGTEADNLAVLGLARSRAALGKHLVTSPTEHHAVLHAVEHLCKHEGFEVTILAVDAYGRVDPAHLAAAIRPDTVLVTIMSANNETGTMQPIADLARVCRERGVPFHSDMIQSFGKGRIAPHDLGLDAASFASHKIGGPKGAGLLFLKAGLPIESILHGGFHENSRRPGTENVAAIAGFAAAAGLAHRLPDDSARQVALRESLWSLIRGIAPDAIRNGHPEEALPNTLNASFPGADGETLLIGLDLEGVCASSGSACMVGSVMPSHVLLAMGVEPAMARAAIRFSMGRCTTGEDIRYAAQALGRVLERQAFAGGVAP